TSIMIGLQSDAYDPPLPPVNPVPPPSRHGSGGGAHCTATALVGKTEKTVPRKTRMKNAKKAVPPLVVFWHLLRRVISNYLSLRHRATNSYSFTTSLYATIQTILEKTSRKIMFSESTKSFRNP